MSELFELIIKSDAVKLQLKRPLTINDFAPVLEESNNLLSFINDEEALKFEMSGKKMYATYKVALLHTEDIKKAFAEINKSLVLGPWLLDIFKVHRWEVCEIKSRSINYEQFQEKIKGLEGTISQDLLAKALADVTNAINSLNSSYFKKYGLL